MAQLRQDYDKFTAQDTEIIAVGPENDKAFLNYWQKNDLPFVGLPDPTHSVLKLYGQEVKLFKFGRMPAQVTIDKNGTARFVHYGHDMTDIPANEEILTLLASMNQEPLSSQEKNHE
jgi:peroxiredoxin Q/BCP